MNVHVLVNVEGVGGGILSIASFNRDQMKRRKRSWLAVTNSLESWKCYL